MNRKASGFFSKILALSLVIFILGILLISGPAQAFTTNMNIDKNTIKRGEKITFDISIKIDQTDGTLPIQQITLLLDGPIKTSCVFSPEGEIITGCVGVINILKNTNSTYGYGQSQYGYGYSNGELNYVIELDSSTYPLGIYESALAVKVANSFFSYNGGKIHIVQPSSLEDRGAITRNFDKINEHEESILTLFPGSEYMLKIKEEYHILKVNYIDNEKIGLTISSNLQELNLTPNELYELDMENDGKNDLKMAVWYLGEKEAVLYFESERTIVFEEIPVKKENNFQQSLISQLPKENVLEEQNPSILGVMLGIESLGINFFVIFLGALVLVEIIGIAVAFLRR